MLVNGVLWFGLDIAEVREQTKAKYANFANLMLNILAGLFALVVFGVYFH